MSLAGPPSPAMLADPAVRNAATPSLNDMLDRTLDEFHDAEERLPVPSHSTTPEGLEVLAPDGRLAPSPPGPALVLPDTASAYASASASGAGTPNRAASPDDRADVGAGSPPISGTSGNGALSAVPSPLSGDEGIGSSAASNASESMPGEHDALEPGVVSPTPVLEEGKGTAAAAAVAAGSGAVFPADPGVGVGSGAGSRAGSADTAGPTETPPTSMWEPFDLGDEYARMAPDQNWRATTINHGWEVCNTYPRKLYVPAAITDDQLRSAARYRSKGCAATPTLLRTVSHSAAPRASGCDLRRGVDA